MNRLSLLTVTYALAAVPTLSSAAQDDENRLEYSLSSGIVHQIESDIDNGGDYRVTRFDIGLSAGTALSEDVNMTLSLGFARDVYGFGGSMGFAGLDPWDDVSTVRFGARFTAQLDEFWGIYGGPILSFAAEDGADWGDSFAGGGIVGVTLRATGDLTIGAGIGAMTQIEDDVAVFPVITLNWELAENLTLRTSGGVGSSGGGGLELVWNIADDWDLAFGGRYETRRFRIDDNGLAPDGVGEEKTLPLYVRLAWRPQSNASVNLVAGWVTSGKLSLEDDDGDTIRNEDFDTTPFVGASLTLRF